MRRFACWRHQFLLQMWPFLCSGFVPPTRALWLIRILFLLWEELLLLSCSVMHGLGLSLAFSDRFILNETSVFVCLFVLAKRWSGFFWYFLYWMDEAGWCVKAKLPSHPYRSSIQTCTAARENSNYCILQANEGGLFAHDTLKTWLLKETSVDNCL